MLVTGIPNKPTKDTETKEYVEPGSIRALGNKVWIQIIPITILEVT